MKKKGTLHLGTLLLVALLCPVAAEAKTEDSNRMTQELAQATAAVRDLAKRCPKYDAVFRRDPMRPLVDAQGRLVGSTGLTNGLSVQGIIWSDAHPLAVADDELFPEGAEIGPYTILKITPDGVLAQRDGDTLTIPLDRGL